MKKIVFLFFFVFLFNCFFMSVYADEVSVNVDIAPMFNTEFKSGGLVLTVSDTSGINNSSIKMYKVNKNKKILSEVSFKSSKVTKTSSFGNVEYEYTIDNKYLSDSTNYFYLSIVDKSGLKNDSYFRVIKKKNGKYSKYFAPKMVSFSSTNTDLNYSVTDSGTIKSLIIKDLNANKVVKTVTNKKSSFSDKISLNSFVSSNNSRYIEVYTEDEDGNTARRTYKIISKTVNTNAKKANNNEQPVSISKDKVLKVLLIGNSYTYYNDYGGILAELAKKQGRKMIVVNAVHGGRDGYCLTIENISAYVWDNRSSKTSLQKLYKSSGTYSLESFNNNSKKVKKYNLKLTDAINYDWGNLSRAGKWDYVVLQNHYKGEMQKIDSTSGMTIDKYCNLKYRGTRKNKEVICKDSKGNKLDKKKCRKYYEKNDTEGNYLIYSNESNLLIYENVKNSINSDTSKFIILRTFATDWPSHTSKNNYMRKSALANGFTFVDTRMLAKAITGEKKEDRLNNFTILDGSEHPAPKGAYLMATSVYASIFGTSELASSINDSNYIKLYNAKGSNFKGVITNALYSKSNAKSYAMSVDADTARLIQSTVYNNFEDYIVYYK